MKYAKKVLSLLLPLVLILAMVPATALAADTIRITVRVYDETTYTAYEVGSDTVQKVDGQIQSQPYRIRPLSDFTDGTWKSISKVAGNWYFPSGDMNVGSNVYFSNNASTATITYWVRGFQESPSGGTTTPPPDGARLAMQPTEICGSGPRLSIRTPAQILATPMEIR